MWLLLLLALCCLGQANSVNVYFQSENFHNVLHWDKIDIPGQAVLYSVEFNEYGNRYIQKRECQNIAALSCDLSEETPVKGHNDIYTARVNVSGKEIGRTRFSPLRTTTLGPPNVTVTFSDTTVMIVRVGLPNGPNNRSIKEFLPPPIVYNVTLTHNKSGQAVTQVYTNTSELFVISKLQKNTKYCGSVSYNKDFRRLSSKAFTFCMMSPGDVEKTPFLLLIPIGIGLLLLIAISGVAWCFLTRKTVPEPESLNVKSFDPRLLTIHEKNCISRVELQPEKPKVPILAPGKKQAFGKVEGYAPQDNCTDLAWHCETYANQQVALPEDSQEDSGISTTTYSLLVMAQVLNSSGDESSPTDEGLGTRRLATGRLPAGPSALPDGPTLPVSDPPEGQSGEAAANQGTRSPEPGPLRLQTSLSPGGGLRLLFQLPSSGATGTCSPEAEVSERTALLSDPAEAGGGAGKSLFLPTLSSLIVKDSDCPDEESEEPRTNTHISNEVVPSPQVPTSYLPVREHFSSVPQVLPGNPSCNYKQNWLPGMVHESSPGSLTTLQTSWVSSGEVEQQEKEEASRGIFLGGWGVQIKS
ncbi:hypothetical protein ACEWY4_020278 [Coilia grayii]|uniref:Fibronectin type-III domain-containing protein n=1 Tax=Coilia grayii TaxID=363190 RepID=A0ABD1JDT5_9TELE